MGKNGGREKVVGEGGEEWGRPQDMRSTTSILHVG